MKKKVFVYALVGVIGLAMTACQQNQPEPIPASFPKKHIIEEFTSQSCGYCPAGMDYTHEFLGEDTTWILIMHHAGYASDKFTINASKKISNKLGVSGAPSVAVDRTKAAYDDGNAVVFHPYYLTTIDRSQFGDSTYASVRIANAYNADNRTLKVTVSGAICTEEHPQLNLSVFVKESGMIAKQTDYYHTGNSWKEFCHTDAPRACLTAPLGDSLQIDATRHYRHNYELTLDEAWVADSCMVVAFITEGFKPIIQAEQRPVVAGTTGGANARHGGIQ